MNTNIDSIYQTLVEAYSPIANPPAFVSLRDLAESDIKNNEEIKSILEKIESDSSTPDVILPDQDSYFANVEAWANGAEDGTSWFHVQPNAEESEKLSATTYALIDKLKNSFSENDEDFLIAYDELKNVNLSSYEGDEGLTPYRISVISFAFPLLNLLIKESDGVSDEEKLKLYELGKFLAFETPDRVTVKIGLLIMGSVLNMQKTDEDFDKAMILGKHDEFTWYVGRFLYQTLQNPLAQLWQLAIETKGWGRIHSIYAIVLLLGELKLPAPYPLRYWLLTGGYQNEVMRAYTAAQVIELGQLSAELEKEEIDESILRGAANIFQAVITGGPINFNHKTEEFQRMFERYSFHLNKTTDKSDNFSINN